MFGELDMCGWCPILVLIHGYIVLHFFFCGSQQGTRFVEQQLARSEVIMKMIYQLPSRDYEPMSNYLQYL